MSNELRCEQVKVFCRIRPNPDQEDECISVVDECSLSLQNKRSFSGRNIHSFSRVFAPDATQSDVFKTTLLPYVKSVLEGENVLFFTYGVTGSGKTYTMQGTPKDPGLVPRTLDTIFNSISTYSTLKYVVKPNGHNGFRLQTEAEAIMDRQRLDYTSNPRNPYRSNLHCSSMDGRFVDTTVLTVSQKSLYTVFISFIELYNDVIYDLLDASTGGCAKTINLHEDIHRNIYAHGVTELEVKASNEALKAYYQGQKRRRVGATALNKDSSRSHGIFTIKIVRTGYDPNYDEVIMDDSLITVSQLCLVDLAGSERTSRSGTTGGRLKEAATINKSLLTLRKCVEVLRMNQVMQSSLNQSVQQQIVPYRDCKLTRIFKSFFEGCGQVAILICVHKTMEEYAETAHVLQFAGSSQQVSTTLTPAPVATPLVRSARHSRRSSTLLLVSNEELKSAIAKMQTLDASLAASVSDIVSADVDSLLLNFCDCFPNCSDGHRRNTKNTRPSFTPVQNGQHSVNCPLLSVLRARAEEHNRMRGVLVRFGVDLQSYVGQILRRAESGDSHLSLLNTLDSLNVEKLQMESRIRYLENEVTKQKTLVRHERAERLREANGARAQLKRLRGQVDVAATPRTAPRLQKGRRKASNASSSSSCSTIDDVANSKRCSGLVRGTPATSSRVAVLSRQWEMRLAAKQQQEEAMRLYLANGNAKTPIQRFRTDVTLGRTPFTDALNRPPAINPRHRRSKSLGGGGVWLEHKENHPTPLGTIFSPTGIHVRKSVTQLELDDTLKATDYVLHHQTATPDGNVETQLFKGSIIPTAGGGSAVVFNDVEELRQVSPLNSGLRRSARLSSKHSLPLTKSDETAVDEQPPAAKRSAPSRHGKLSRSRQPSLVSTTSGISSTACDGKYEQENAIEDDTRSQTSYQTISPPSMQLDMSRFYGIASTGGISGVGKREF
uniref:Kinesin-like protein n=3 Tax=Mesocestoides corti TaxID=53468 RepID=A0A5K3F5D3_MESCO